MRQATGKSGYLDVKLPAKSRGRGPRAWKAWKRRWIVLHGLHDLGTGGTVVTLDMYHNANVEGQQLERSTIYLEAVTLLQRAASRSHPYAFCIEAKQTVVHLAAACESDTQEWMDVFRNVLWPAAPTLNNDAAFREAYPVAVIDTNFSALFGVRGGACLLLISDAMLLLRCTYTDHVLLEWPPTALARVYLANAPETKDQGRVFVIEPRPHCGGWTAPLHFYSAKAQEIVKDITKSMRQGKRGDTLPRESCSRLPFYPEVLSACRSSYAGGFSLNLTESMEDLTSLNSEFLLTALYDQPRANSTQFCPNTTMSSDETDWEKIETPLQSFYDQPRMSSAGETETMLHTMIQGSQDTKEAGSRVSLSVRKSKSESDLLDCGCRAINSKRTTRSDSTLDLTLISLPPSQEPTIPDSENENVILRNKRTRNCTPDNMESICSSLSSRDSGVQLSSLDESNASDKAKPVASEAHICYTHSCNENTESQDEKSELDLQFEFLQMQQDKGNFNLEVADDCHSLSNTSSRTSTSESSSHEDSLPPNLTNSGIYSEINTNRDSKLPIPEPMYEDLDRFRKDINKLLGIPPSSGQHISKSGFQKGKEPPPLPPRCTRLDPKLGSARKKDMIRFLGIDDPLAKEMIRVQQATATPSPKDGVRRKNLYRFLGVDSKTASAPVPDDPQVKSQRPGSVPFGNMDGTYDVPPNQLRYMAPSNPKLQRGESRSRKFSGNLLRLFKEKEPESQFNFPPVTPDSRSQTLPANKSSIHRSHSTGIYNTQLPAFSNTNNALIMFGKEASPEITNDKDAQTQPSLNQEDNAAAIKLSSSTSHDAVSILYNKFADDLVQGIWSSAKVCLPVMSNNNTADNTNDNILLEIPSNNTNETTPDSVYLEMTAKLRHFANVDDATANRESAMYQAMFLRTLSNASYISIDMNRVQSLLANSAEDADLAAEIRSENSSSDFLKFAQELAEMSKIAFSENDTDVSIENDCVISDDNVNSPDSPTINSLTKIENDTQNDILDTETSANTTTDTFCCEEGTNEMQSESNQILIPDVDSCQTVSEADDTTNDDTTNDETFTDDRVLSVENITECTENTSHSAPVLHLNEITLNKDSVQLQEHGPEQTENISHSSSDENSEEMTDKNEPVLAEMSMECSEHVNQSTQDKESDSLCDAEVDNIPDDRQKDVQQIANDESANDEDAKNFNIDELHGTMTSESSDNTMKTEDDCSLPESTKDLQDELTNKDSATPLECSGDCLVENWALHTANFDDPVQSLTLCCQQAQVTVDDTNNDIAHQFVSILSVCLRSDQSAIRTVQENHNETGLERITLITPDTNADTNEAILVSSATEDITRPVSPIAPLTEEAKQNIEQNAAMETVNSVERLLPSTTIPTTLCDAQTEQYEIVITCDGVNSIASDGKSTMCDEPNLPEQTSLSENSNDEVCFVSGETNNASKQEQQN